MLYLFGGDGAKTNQHFVLYEQRLKMIKWQLPKVASDSDSDPETVHPGTTVTEGPRMARTRKVVLQMSLFARKLKQQQTRESSKKHMKLAGKATEASGVGVGAIVCLNVDYRTHFAMPLDSLEFCLISCPAQVV